MIALFICYTACILGDLQTSRLKKQHFLGKNQLPEKFSWRQDPRYKDSAIETVYDQQDYGNCDGCWAFASVNVAASYLQLVTKGTRDEVSAPMSVQHQLDCDRRRLFYYGVKAQNNGCNGGNSFTSFREIALNLGTVTEECYPKSGNNRQQKCSSVNKKTLQDCRVYKTWDNGTNFFRPITFDIYDYDVNIDYQSLSKIRKNQHLTKQTPLVTAEDISYAFKEIIYNCGPAVVSMDVCDSFDHYSSVEEEGYINIYKEDLKELNNHRKFHCGSHEIGVISGVLLDGHSLSQEKKRTTSRQIYMRFAPLTKMEQVLKR
ncbi:MAG: hypothetical protein EZS28_026723 [Streblomastix strix]|uniref:Peptidase C1A papain C-terminal domain-containing protein n=1 Tax=Streblomastix strix TaxID=222440 RepID=A0A5J4V6I3_9EUKA|nr:MAG: hypothetical protein EZS28_026723 [Streblomastix strix]